MTWSRWKIAGLLFVIGGALTILGALVGLAGSAIGGTLGLIGLLLEGAGFILFGIGFRGTRSRRWVPWLYLIAGALMAVSALLWLVGGSWGAITLVVQLVIAALILVASILLLTDRGADRLLWIVLIVLGALLVISAFIGNIVLAILIGAAYILAGILLWGVRLGRRRP